MIKLGRLKQVPSVCSAEGVATNAYIAAAENLDLDLYDDITSAVNWEKYWETLGKDYKWYRRRLQDLGNVDDTTWNTYSDNEKKIIAKEKATVPFTRIRAMFTDAELTTHMSLFDEKSYMCRKARFSKAKTMILNNLHVANQYQILSILNADKLETNYVTMGIEGRQNVYQPDPIEAIFDFVQATPISYYEGLSSPPVLTDAFGQPLGKYENTGIGAMSLIFLSGSPYTQETLIEAIVSILKEGDY